MSKTSPAEPKATTAQIKADIDSGQTGDKVAGFDPAAAPLGTDDEAGGTPASPELIAHARAAEKETAPTSRDKDRTPPLKESAAPAGRPPADKALIKGVTAGSVAGLMLVLILSLLERLH